MEEKFNYNCSLESFFTEYLRLKLPYINAVLSHIHGSDTRLNDNPLKVLAQLLFYNNRYKDLSEKARWKMVFDYDTKQEICKELRMPPSHLNSYLSQLRRLKIVKGRKIDEFYVIYPRDEVQLTFNLKVSMDEAE